MGLPDGNGGTPPTAGIVIAAHNEATVIGRCLDALLGQAEDGEFDVTVIANGCTDDTARVATRDGVRVLDIAVASKVAALNAGDEVTQGFPRIYLDADIVVTTAGLRAIRDALVVGDRPDPPLAAVPGRKLDLRGASMLVRGYYAINSRLPVFESGLFGRGLIGLSAKGRGRFDQFPDLVADDLFLDSLFTTAEKVQVDGVTTTIAVPRRTADLVRRLVRVRRGNAAMRLAGATGQVAATVRTADRGSWWRDVVRPSPSLAPAGVAYVGITVWAALLAKRKAPAGKAWGRDDSTRVEPTPDVDHSDAREGTDGG